MGDNSSLSPSTILWNGLTTPYLVQDPNLLENFIKKFENVNVTSLTLSFNRAPLTFSKIDIDWSAAVKARRVSAERFFSTSTTGSVTFAFSAFQSVDDVRDLLLALVYDHKGADLMVGFVRIITVVVDYKNGTEDLTTPPVNITIEYIGENDDPPVISISELELDFTEGQMMVELPNITVTDGDHSSFLLKSARVQVLGMASEYDGLNCGAQDLPANITCNETEAGKLEFDGDGSPEDYSEALSAVTYFNWAPDVGGLPFSSRDIEYSVYDGENTGKNTTTLQLVNINDAPELAFGNQSRESNYVYNEDTPEIRLHQVINLTISDSDNSNVSNATVLIDVSSIPEGTIEYIPPTESGLSANVKDGDNTVQIAISGDASIEHYEDALLGIGFRNQLPMGQSQLNGFNFTVTFTVNDGMLNSNSITLLVKFVPANDAPLLYYSETPLPGDMAAPLSHRQRNLTFVEDGMPMFLLQNSNFTRLEDIEGDNIVRVTVTLQGAADGDDEVLFVNSANHNHNITQTRSISLEMARQVLLSVQYQNKKKELPTKNTRTVSFIVEDQNGGVSAPFLVYIEVEQRNDAPSVDIGQGFSSIGSDKVDFKEGSLFGTYILTNPHKIEVIDEDTTENGNGSAIFHYINRLVVILKTTGCGKLDYDETTCTGDFLYWLKPISDDRIKLVSVGFVNGTASYEIVLETEGVVSNQSDAAALDDAYEDFVASIRFINNKDEPTLYCDDGQGNITKFERQTMVIITDNGSPPQSAVITTTINIQTINDHKPTFIFYLSLNDSCLALKNSRRRRSLEKKPSTDSTKDSPPSVSSLTAFGFSDGKLSPGSSIWVNFSHDTNMPQVLTRDQLEQIVKISPSSLAKEIHLGFWATSKSLVIVYPAVRDDIDTPLHTKDIALTFMSRLDSSEGCKYSVCHSDGQSRGVQGTFSVEGSQEQQQPKAPCDDALSDQAIDIEQTQLHDWALIGLAFAGFIIAVSVVIYLGCRRTR
eukprot:m.181762 g.181762  ORF g.181762 m.181762 type:complete len:990 (+) comp39278_c1_seq51:4155-7124(+)